MKMHIQQRIKEIEAMADIDEQISESMRIIGEIMSCVVQSYEPQGAQKLEDNGTYTRIESLTVEQKSRVFRMLISQLKGFSNQHPEFLV